MSSLGRLYQPRLRSAGELGMVLAIPSIHRCSGVSSTATHTRRTPCRQRRSVRFLTAY